MSLIAEAFQPHIPQELCAITGPASASVASLLGTDFQPSLDLATKTWTLDFRSTIPLDALAGECARFACAAFQSYEGVGDALDGALSIPWALVRAYYAAFYSGQSLLRALGDTNSQIDVGRAEKISDVASLYGIRTPFSRGQYAGSIGNRGSTLTFHSVTFGKGGFHETFWTQFNCRLKRVEDSVMNGTLLRGDANRVFLALAGLRDALTNKAAHQSWLSSVRNEVQYRHARGVWFPEAIRAKDRTALSRLAHQWKRNPLEIDLTTSKRGELGLFLAACTFMVATCRVVMEHIAARCPTKKSFISYGPLAYLARHS